MASIPVEVPALKSGTTPPISTTQIDFLLGGLDPQLQFWMILSSLIPTFFLSLALSGVARTSLALRKEKPFSRRITRTLKFSAGYVLVAGVVGVSAELWTDRQVLEDVVGTNSALAPGIGGVNGILVFLGMCLVLVAAIVSRAGRLQRDTDGLV